METVAYGALFSGQWTASAGAPAAASGIKTKNDGVSSPPSGIRTRIVVPVFQRTYCWPASKVRAWWRDAALGRGDSALRVKDGHATGRCLFRRVAFEANDRLDDAEGGEGEGEDAAWRAKKTRENVAAWLCLDGQQRCTTTQLAVAAVRDAAEATLRAAAAAEEEEEEEEDEGLFFSPAGTREAEMDARGLRSPPPENIYSVEEPDGSRGKKSIDVAAALEVLRGVVARADDALFTDPAAARARVAAISAREKERTERNETPSVVAPFLSLRPSRADRDAFARCVAGFGRGSDRGFKGRRAKGQGPTPHPMDPLSADDPREGLDATALRSPLGRAKATLDGLAADLLTIDDASEDDEEPLQESAATIFSSDDPTRAFRGGHARGVALVRGARRLAAALDGLLARCYLTRVEILGPDDDGDLPGGAVVGGSREGRASASSSPSSRIDLTQMFQWLQEKTLFAAGAVLWNPAPGVAFGARDLIRNAAMAAFLDEPVREQENALENLWQKPLADRMRTRIHAPSGNRRSRENRTSPETTAERLDDASLEEEDSDSNGDAIGERLDEMFRAFLNERRENASRPRGGAPPPWRGAVERDVAAMLRSDKTPESVRERLGPGSAVETYARWMSFAEELAMEAEAEEAEARGEGGGRDARLAATRAAAEAAFARAAGGGAEARAFDHTTSAPPPPTTTTTEGEEGEGTWDVREGGVKRAGEDGAARRFAAAPPRPSAYGGPAPMDEPIGGGAKKTEPKATNDAGRSGVGASVAPPARVTKRVVREALARAAAFAERAGYFDVYDERARDS